MFAEEDSENIAPDSDVSFVPDSPVKPKPKPKAKTTGNAPLADGESASASTGASASAAASSSASAQYQKLSQLEHVLKRPDTYIGSVEPSESKMWVFDPESQQMQYKTVTIVPGLYKIFDEILVNAADNKIRDPSMDALTVDIDVDKNLITIYNNGRGIPVEIHDKEKMYIPQMIFGNLLTSSNYDDAEKKVTGGRNGFGAKLCNIFSTKFTLETADKSNGKKYVQTWSDNMSKVTKPKITDLKKDEQYTKITFEPDLKLFHMEKIDNDLLGVMMRRVYDLAGSVQGIKVTLNKQRLKIKTFKAYVDMYMKSLQEQAKSSGDDETVVEKETIVYEKINDRWEVAFAPSDGTNFNQMSFVNSIATTSGGTHVNYIADQFVTKILEQVKKKNKSAPIKPAQVRNSMFVFINCLIENPAFTSQTKEQLTTKTAAFGSKCVISDDFMKKVMKTSIMDRLLNIAEQNIDKDLKKSDGGRKRRLTGYAKLDDANMAGTREGHKCTLILTEGDSAKTLAVAGLAVVGRDYYGVFPLRGKMLNVREASHDQIMKNAEIQAIKQIMGLQHKKQYTSTEGLRYGHVMIMTDQDHDGSHIKGLIINFLESSFPGLLDIPGFLIEFITPIVKVSILRNKKVVQVIPFYTMPQYETWRDTEGKTCIWRQKYYKGLGTSEPNREGREYFMQLDRHLKKFHELQDGDKGLIELAFAKKNADARKDWLRAFKPGTHLDPDISVIPIGEFINKELILFSMADNIRSIPAVLDGLKPGQRKILYGCFKRRLTTEIKVAQLGGYVSENTGYHHGEQSLYQTIIGLAQDFVGSNNLYFLMPNGAFGSRATGGKDASAPRYIFTELNKLTRIVFNPLDDPLYRYVEDDDTTVEPEWYLPVLPTLLVNGAEGIGTGWSTNIPSFNPADIVTNIRALMDGRDMEPMTPWFRGWTGTIERNGPDKYTVYGTVQQVDDTTVEITELPVRMWTQTMKEYLLAAIVKDKRDKNDQGWIEDFTEEHGVGVKFVVKMTQAQMASALQAGLVSRFKLSASMSLSNMMAFDPNGRIKKYDTPEQILTDFYYVRLEFYQKRKDHISNQLRNELEKLSQQARFIKLIVDSELEVANRKRQELISELENRNFPKFGDDNVPVWVGQEAPEDKVESDLSVLIEEQDDEEAKALLAAETVNKPKPVSYDYLLSMQIWSLTRERYERLLKKKGEVEVELTDLLKLSAKDLWNRDLDIFLEGWQAFLKDDEDKRVELVKTDQNKKKPTKRRAKKNDDEEYGAKRPKTKAKATVATAVKAEAPKTDSLLGNSGTPHNLDADNFLAELNADFKAGKVATSNETKKPIFDGSVFGFSDDDDDVKVEVGPKAAAGPTAVAKPKAVARSKTAKPAAKKAKVDLNFSGDEDVAMEAAPAPAVARPTRRAAAAAPSKYKFDDSSMMEDVDDADDGSEFELSEQD